MSRRRRSRFAVRTLLLVGLAIGAFGLVWGTRTALFVAKAERAPGTVILNQPIRRGDHHHGRRRRPRAVTYRPVFEFAAASGTRHQVTNRIGSTFFRGFTEGSTVTVLFESDNPDDAMIQAFSTLWLGPVFLTGFGALFTTLTLLAARRME
jgi:hypothetical protein